jgi:predicted secreted protein
MPEEAAADQPIHVVAAHPFHIDLGSGPSSGYLWRLATHPPEVRLLRSDFSQAPDAAIGDGGTQVFHLVADGPGTFELCFVLKRPWEDEVVLTRTFEVIAS